MSAIVQALGSGFSAQQILKYLSQNNPKLAQQISSALNAGHSVDHVLNYIQRNSNKIGKLIPDQGERRKNPNLFKEAQQSIHPAISNATKFGLGTAAALGGAAVAAPIASQASQYALSRALPPALTQGGPAALGSNPAQQIGAQVASLAQPSQLGGNTGINTQQILQNNAVSKSQQPPNVSQPNIPQPQQVLQPKAISINPVDVLDKFKSKQKVDELASTGNDAQSIGGFFRKFHPQIAKDIEKEAGLDLENVIEGYLAKKGQNSQKAPEIAQKLNEIEGKAALHEAESPKVAKGSTVASSQGIGEILELRNGQAIVDIDGKKVKVPESELQSEPEEIRDSKFDFDPASIPEDLRSAPLNEVYVPGNRKHVTVKYNAGLKPVRYQYFRKDGKPISEDFIEKIKKGVQLPVSSGLNFWGGWNADESDSRGSANHEELVSNAQLEGEKDNPSKEYWFVKEEAIYEHPYLEKAGKEQLRKLEKEFNEAQKKSKKKRT